MRIVYIAEITGKPGVFMIKKHLHTVRHLYEPDVVIGNANSATGSGGIGKQHAVYLKKLGIQCITAGDNVFQKQDTVLQLAKLRFLLRPHNLPAASPGFGYALVSTNAGTPVAVLSLLGRIGHHRLHADNPFTAAAAVLPQIREQTPFIIVDFSASATAEKQAMGFFLDGKVAAVIGSGTKAMTADCRILDNGTAYITDAGRTGSFDSVGGYTPDDKIREYRTGLFEYPHDSWNRLQLQGLIIDIDAAGRSLSVQPMRIEHVGP